MRVILDTGKELDLPDRAAVEARIREFETGLKRLRRLLQVIKQLEGGHLADDEDDPADPPAGGADEPRQPKAKGG